MKLIGLDVGTKRIGVAKADTSVRIAVPICTINVDGTEFAQIERIAAVQGTDFFVIGLPRNNNGEETEQSRYSREFANTLKSTISGARIAFQDESLTSVEAENRLKNSKKPIKKGDIDAEAATIILQDFIENIHSGANLSEDFKNTGVMPPAKKKSKFRKNLKKIVSIALLSLALICGGASLYYFINLGPVKASDGSCVLPTAENLTEESVICETKPITIAEGSSVSNIASSLKSRLLIKNEFIFKVYLKLSGNSGNLKAGTFNVSSAMSIPEIVALLSDGQAGVISHRITTLPGGTLTDFKNTLSSAGFNSEEISSALNKNYMSPVLSSKPANASLEGYIYGETIEYTSTQTISDIIEKLLREYEKTVATYNIENALASHGLSLHEGIILASIIQKEANNPEDMAMVAGIFYNRLELGIPLGSDVTTKYALDLVDPDRVKYPDIDSQLNIDSCYNTRLHAGLPCGPINTPGISALKAIARPADTSYLYFLTGDDGVMYYGNTIEEHNANIVNHCQKLCSGSL